MEVQLNKVLAPGTRPGYGTFWQLKDLPELQLVQGLYGNKDWSIVRGGDGFFFLAPNQPISLLAQGVLDKIGNRPYPSKAKAIQAYQEIAEQSKLANFDPQQTMPISIAKALA